MPRHAFFVRLRRSRSGRVRAFRRLLGYVSYACIAQALKDRNGCSLHFANVCIVMYIRRQLSAIHLYPHVYTRVCVATDPADFTDMILFHQQGAGHHKNKSTTTLPDSPSSIQVPPHSTRYACFILKFGLNFYIDSCLLALSILAFDFISMLVWLMQDKPTR